MQIKLQNYIIEYTKTGTGEMPVLLLHGWGGNKDSLSCFSKMLDNSKYTFYALTLDSEYNSKSLSMPEYCKIVENFIKEMSIYNCIVICHSFGARIAFMLAGKFENYISKLIVIAGAGIKPRFNLNTYIKVKRYKWLKKRNKLKDKNYGSSDYNALSNISKQTFVNVVNFDIEKFTYYINKPTLLIYGNKDKQTPLYMAKKLHKNIKNSKLIVLKGCSHFCYEENFSDCLFNIKEFLC